MLGSTLKTALRRTSARLARSNQFPRMARVAQELCVHYLRERENWCYDANTNGERWLLSTLARAGRLERAFDVGANVGEWGNLALLQNPGVELHCFELCSPTFERLSSAIAKRAGVHLNDVGLSDQVGETRVDFCASNDRLSSAVKVIVCNDVQSITGRTTTGARYCQSREIQHIDMLKIDVEGLEDRVLKGFGDMLVPTAIPFIQFEYGMVNIESHFLLKDFYALLEPRGYKVGKLFPNRIRLRSYRYEDEDFLGPNYVAVCPRAALELGLETA